MAWPMVAGAIIGAVSNTGNNIMQIRENRYARNQARHAAKNAYQWATADMRKAGLNPILAATGGLKPASYSGGGSGTNLKDYDWNQAALNFYTAKQMKEVTKKVEEERELVAAQKAGVQLDNRGKSLDLQRREFQESYWKGANKLRDWVAENVFGGIESTAKSVKEKYQKYKGKVEKYMKDWREGKTDKYYKDRGSYKGYIKRNKGPKVHIYKTGEE